MRVIAGNARGRKLQAVPGKLTRPTTDRVKEAIFSIVGPYFNGGLGLDLFAGSGSLGIEGLSRGLKHVIFVERDKQAVYTIHQNIQSLRLVNFADVYQMDAFKALSYFKRKNMQFDAIFLDPPYGENILPKVLRYIALHDIVKDNGFVMAEYMCGDDVPCHVLKLEESRRKQYGDICISIYYPNPIITVDDET